MSREYCVPKRQVRARVILTGQPPADVKLFLNECAETHEGHERPIDLLNGSQAFIPAMSQDGEVVLLHRDNLMVVSLATGDESANDDMRLGEQDPGNMTVVMVELIMQDGTTVRGEVSYLMPESRRRLQDFLNTAERFLALREGAVMHLVNKRRISRISTV